GQFEAEDSKNLETILREASTAEKTVLVTMMNQAYADLNSTFDVFLEGFQVGDGTEKTTGIDFSGERLFTVGDYLEMMWRRTEFLGSLLKLGYNFLFTDMDTVWLRDPFPRLIPDVDFQIACDRFNGNSSGTRNYADGGFKFVVANHRTIEFYKYWYVSRLRYPGNNEQDDNKMKDLRQVLDDWTAYFSNGDRAREFRQPMNCWRSLRRQYNKERG
ncbi:hypothetical protein DY000_02022974, partial [Brassica cretica]